MADKSARRFLCFPVERRTQFHRLSFLFVRNILDPNHNVTGCTAQIGKHLGESTFGKLFNHLSSRALSKDYKSFIMAVRFRYF